MMIGRAIRCCAPAWASLALLVVLASGTHAQDVAPVGPDGLRDMLRTWSLYQEIELLETANRIGLTSEQAAQCAVAIQTPAAELRRVREIECSEQLRQALAEIRATMLKGGDATDDQWVAIHTATVGRLAPGTVVDEGDDPLERHKAELADQIGTAIAGVLTQQQLARLGSSEPQEVAGSIAEELAEQRAAAPDEWTAFRAEAIANLRQAFAEVEATPEEKVFEDVGAFLDRVRAMNTDTYFARQDELRDEFVSIVAGETQTPEAGRMRAINRLGEWAEVWTLMELLQEMAAAERHFVLP